MITERTEVTQITAVRSVQSIVETGGPNMKGGSKTGRAQTGDGRTVERTYAGKNVPAAGMIVRAGNRTVQAAASFLAASEGDMTARAPKLPGCACWKETICAV